MVFFVFVFGVLAGIATAALVWVGWSSAAVLAGFGILLVMCAVLSSAVSATISSSEDEGRETPVKKGRAH